MRIRAVSVLLGVLALVVGIGVAASAHPSTDPPVEVTAKDFHDPDVGHRVGVFEPANFSIEQGDHILFRNDSSSAAPHTFSVCDSENCPKAYFLDSGPLSPGQSRFLETKGLPRGDWWFECRIHPSMKGTLTVE